MGVAFNAGEWCRLSGFGVSGLPACRKPPQSEYICSSSNQLVSTCSLICTVPMQAFNLVDSKELVPLQELIDQMVS